MSRLASNESKTRRHGIDVKTIPAKRLYRGVLEYIRRLENGRQHRRNAMSLFLPEQEALRTKLRDACEKLMFSYPLEYGKRAEEFIWRKVYYEVIQLVKRNKRFEKPSAALTAHYRQLLQAGIGFYHHLLLKLQAYFEFESEVDWPFSVSPLGGKSKKLLFDKSKLTDIQNDEDTEDKTKQLHEWSKHMCYRAFMCLGDLGRYQLDFGGSRPFAERFYHLALLAKPNAGMPYNQLGTLAGHYQWWGLNAAYYYYKCLETESKFEGAEGNLQKLLDRNKKTFYHIPTDALENVSTTVEYRKDNTKIFIISFLYLCDLLRPKTYATDVEITGLCKKLIDAFSTCLESILLTEPNDKKEYAAVSNTISRDYAVENVSQMQPHFIFKMTVICIINIHNLQSSRSNRSSAAIAFTLAFFSHLLGFVISNLSQDVKKNLTPLKNGGAGDGLSDAELKSVEEQDEKVPINRHERPEGNEVGGDGDSATAGVRKNKSKKRPGRRRRYRKNDDSDLSEGEEKNPEIVISDSEEDSSLSSDDSLPDSTDSDFSQEEIENIGEDNDTKDKKLKQKSDAESLNPVLATEKRNGLELANSLSSGPSTLASLKDISQKMFQPPVRRKIRLAPSFLNKVEEKEEKTVSTMDGYKIKNDSPMNNPQKEIVVNGEISAEKQDLKVLQTSDVKPEVDNSENTIVDNNNQSEPDENASSHNDAVSGWSFKAYSKDEQMAHFKLIMRLTYFTQSLKLLCDWLAKNKQVTEACAQNSRVLWSRIAKLANLLPNETTFKTMGDEMIDSQVKKCFSTNVSWSQVIKLPEDDVLSRGGVVIDKKTNESILPTKQSNEVQQAAIRVLRYRSLCYSLSKFEGLDITYDSKTQIFTGPEEDSDQQAELEIEAVEEMRKTKLMKDMAALRLKTEVNALEVSLGTTKSRDTSMCLYLVPDTLALCYELHRIKRLVASKRFFLVIPKTVIDGLDGLKKDLQGARDAARYLETEFKKGNRYIRAQMNEESVRGVQGERPKLRKNDMQAWRFYRIIECCRYLMQKEEQNNQDKDHSAHGIVAILTRSTDRSVMSLNQINAVSAAQTLGIQIQGAAEFTKNWKKSIDP